MKPTLFFSFLISTLLVTGAASAHHSFAATYLEETQTIEGDLVEFLFRNPHSLIQIMVVGKDKQEERWTVEWGGSGQLLQYGVTRDTLKHGDHLIVTGNKARDLTQMRLRMVKIVRPKDGWTWSGTVR